jgi:glyoxylase-like metal-dependent hydrolase (beta-lactamase superfamily II)
MVDKVPIWSDGNRHLYVLQFGELRTHTGVFVNEATKSAFTVDAPFGSHESLKNSLLQGVKTEALLITHGHWDHIGDDYLFRNDGAKVYAHGNDRRVIEDPKLMIPYVGSDMGLHPCTVDCAIADDYHFSVAGVEIISRSVPGHSPGGVIFYLECAGVAFVGDTLFRDGIGRHDFFGGDRALLVSGIGEKILSLPDDTIVVPGHGRFTTVGYERKNNEYLR